MPIFVLIYRKILACYALTFFNILQKNVGTKRSGTKTLAKKMFISDD